MCSGYNYIHLNKEKPKRDFFVTVTKRNAGATVKLSLSNGRAEKKHLARYTSTSIAIVDSTSFSCLQTLHIKLKKKLTGVINGIF